jgi:SUN domain-containing protein 1/2
MSSQIGGLGGPTPRRSGRLSSKAGSVVEQSVVTTMTSGGTRQRRKGPLTQVRARKSNAYGASGRVGAAEALSVSATGFAQAFQNQRRNAVARDNQDEDTDDDADELGDEPNMSGALSSNMGERTPTADRQSLPPTSDRQSLPVAPPRFSFAETPDLPSSDDDLAFSIGNTSKSFGMDHEAGMLSNNNYRETIRSSPNFPIRYPVPQTSSSRLPIQMTPEQVAAKAAANRATINKSVDDLIAEERARLQREGRRPLPQQRIQRRSLKSRLEDVKTWLRQMNHIEVPPYDEYDWQWLRYLKWGFWGLLAIGILVLVLPLLPAILSSARSGSIEMGTAIGTRISHTWHGVAEWVKPAARTNQQDADEKINFDLPPGTSIEDTLVLLANARKLDEKIDRKYNIMGNAIREIRERLPEVLVVRRLSNGQYEIPDEFWNALLSKARTKGSSAEWLEFVKTNRDKVQRLNDVPVEVPGSQARPGMISRQEFVNIMDQQYQKISARVDEKVLDVIQQQSTQIKAAVQAETRKTMLDSIRLQSLAQSNLMANYELNLKKPNYFSVGLGATIETLLSSTTFTDSSRSRVGRVTQRILAKRRNPPIAALMGWEEPGDCWCSAVDPTGKGQAQLAVSLRLPVFPKQVTVEHLPMSMVPAGDISTAPREVEFWVQTDQPVRQHYHSRNDKCSDGPQGWTCMGAFKYNIHGSNHVQTFDLDAEVSVPVNRVMIRVISNWGAKHSCIYRVRLHGDTADENHHYPVTLND